MLVKNVMTSNPCHVGSNDSVAHAVRVMNRRNIRHLLVVDGSRLVGILSNNDIPRHIKPQLTVFDVMSPNPASIQTNDSVENARSVMASYRVASLPVLDGNKLVGIVTKLDVS